MFSTDEFHGCGIDGEFHEPVILMIPPSQRSHQIVGFHTIRHGLNEFCHP
jgi:hypothetical protein